MNYIESFNLLGVEAQQIPCITGEGAPKTFTEGAVGCLYMNTLTGDIYKCVAAENGVYTWNNITTEAVTDKVTIFTGTEFNVSGGAMGYLDGISVVDPLFKAKVGDLYFNTETHYLYYIYDITTRTVQPGPREYKGISYYKVTTDIDLVEYLYNKMDSFGTVSDNKSSITLADESPAFSIYGAVGGEIQFDNGTGSIYIRGIGEPDDDHDAANKSYVDATIGKRQDKFAEVSEDKGTITLNDECSTTVIKNPAGGHIEFENGNGGITIQSPSRNVLFRTGIDDTPVELLNIADPTEDNSAVNKAYVDNLLANREDLGEKQDKFAEVNIENGDTQLLFPDGGNDNVELRGATNFIISSHKIVLGDIDENGGLGTGIIIQPNRIQFYDNFHLAGTTLTGVATPTDDDDAVNKAYVDEKIANITITAGEGTGQPTTEGGEIFNLYKDTEIDLGTIGGINIGKQTAPKNQAGEYAHAEGVSTAATGRGSHAEGAGTKADAEGAHAEGAGTLVTGAGSHGEGRGINFSVKVDAIDGNIITVVSNNSSITLRASELEAIKKNAIIWYEKDSSKHDGVFYYATATELNKFLGAAISCKITLDKTPSFTTGTNLTVIMGGALSYISHTEGNYNNAVDIEATNLYGNDGSSHQRQHAEGSRTLSMGYASHTEGEYTVASGDMAHAEGYNTHADGSHSHTEGNNTATWAANAHAEGINTAVGVNGRAAHVEGNATVARGANSHAEGMYSQTNADNAHAEGYDTNARGANSHAEGYKTAATGENAHAGGLCTIAQNDNSTVVGKYNMPNKIRQLTFTLDEDLPVGQLQIVLGNVAESTIENEMTFYNPVLTWNGVAITNPMTKEYFNTMDIQYTGIWNRRSDPSYVISDEGYVIFTDNIAQKPWSAIRYYQNEVELKAGNYVCSIQGFDDIELMPTMEVQLEGTVISANGIYETIDSLFSVGNGSALSTINRSNAFDVYEDGHAELQTMGNTDKSVATKKYVDESLNFKEINSNDLHYGNDDLNSGTYIMILRDLSQIEIGAEDDNSRPIEFYRKYYFRNKNNDTKIVLETSHFSTIAETLLPDLIEGNIYKIVLSNGNLNAIYRQTVDQSYNAESEYAQSGKAVANAITNMADSLENRIAKLEAAIIALGGALD